MTIDVNSIYYYPIKGLGGTALCETEVSEAGLPFDRRFGIAYTDVLPAASTRGSSLPAASTRGSSLPAASTRGSSLPEHWRPWDYFISLKRHPQAFSLRAAAVAEGDSVILTLHHKDGSQLSGNPDDTKERRALEDFISAALQLPQLRLIDSHASPLWDEQGMTLSLMNTDSIADLAAVTGQPLTATRFRANILFSTTAWAEENWREEIAIGKARLKQICLIPRCKATECNPDSGAYDCKPPQLLMQHRGQNALGLYTTVTRGGALARGMTIIPQT